MKPEKDSKSYTYYSVMNIKWFLGPQGQTLSIIVNLFLLQLSILRRENDFLKCTCRNLLRLQRNTTRKSSIERSGKQCIVQIDHLENT